MRIVLLTLMALVAFAANSVLCRLALRDTGIDASSFTLLRIGSGALVLLLIAWLRGQGIGGSWRSGLALFAYAAAFSFAYLGLSTGTGALLLFGAVQATMLGAGWLLGERLRPVQLFGLALALGGLVVLVAPGLSAPSPLHAGLMVVAGMAWGIYSLWGRGSGEPVAATAGNFLRAAPMAALLLLLGRQWDASGAGYAIASGAITSGLGYVAWYAAMPGLGPTRAATVQLSVPVLAAVAGVVLLGEEPTLRLLLASVAVLGGLGLVLRRRKV